MALEKPCLINTLVTGPVLGFLPPAGDSYALRTCKGHSAGDRPGLAAESFHYRLVRRQHHTHIRQDHQREDRMIAYGPQIGIITKIWIRATRGVTVTITPS